MSNRHRFEGKVVVVTGGGAGIGQAAAERFAAEGATVVVIDRSEQEGRATIERIGASASYLQADVTDEGAIQAVFEQIRQKHGHIDCLFNNAGITRRVGTAEIALSDWADVIAVNMTGLLLVARNAVALMPPGSAIVNTASVLGLIGGKKPTIAYQATKGAVISMTRAWAMEWAAQGIRVNAIAPAFVRTPLTESLFSNSEFLANLISETPLGRVAELDDVSGPVLFLASDDARMVTGHILPIDGGILCQ